MDFIYKIEDRLLTELEEIESKMQGGEPISHECLDDIKDISETLNNFSTYSAMKERGMSRGYSRESGNSRGYSRGYSRGGYSRGGYDDWGREPRNMY